MLLRAPSPSSFWGADWLDWFLFSLLLVLLVVIVVCAYAAAPAPASCSLLVVIGCFLRRSSLSSCF